jgi:hypothetical protein
LVPMRRHQHLATRWRLTVPRARVCFFYFYSTLLHFVLVIHKSLTYSNNQVSTGITDGVESSNGDAGRHTTIAGITKSLVKMSTGGDSPSSAALTAATNLTSTDGVITTRGEPKMKKPWDAYPNFTVNAGCTKCRGNWWGCQGNKPNECLSDIEHKVRTSIKTLMVKADPGKYKSTKSIHFKDHLKKEDGTPSDEVAKRLPAALKSNGYTQHDIDEWSMDLARDR